MAPMERMVQDHTDVSFSYMSHLLTLSSVVFSFLSITSGSQGQPDVNGLVTSPTSNASPSLGEDPVDDTLSPLKSTNTEEGATEEEQQNENNNNPCKNHCINLK